MDPRIIERINSIVTYLRLSGIEVDMHSNDEIEYSFRAVFSWGRIIITYNENYLFVSVGYYDEQIGDGRRVKRKVYTHEKKEELLNIVTNRIVYYS